MMRCNRSSFKQSIRVVWLVFCAAGLTCAFAETARAVHPSQSIDLQEPNDGIVIFNRRLKIKGAVTNATRVAVLVQGMVEEQQPWRVMQMFPTGRQGRFETTLPLREIEYDVAYRVIVLAGTGTHAMRQLKPGVQLQRPPEQVVCSDVIRITIAGSSRPGPAPNANITERLLLPVPGSKVGPLETVIVEGSGDAEKVVVLVRAEEPGAAWYVQGNMQPAGPGKTAVRARFGGQKTPAETPFRVRIAMPEGRAQVAFFKSGAAIKQLPQQVAYGPPALVRFDPDKLPTVDLERLKFNAAVDQGERVIRLLSPVEDAVVPRVINVTGVRDDARIPVLLVRSELDAKVWYVQQPCEVMGKRFAGKAYLGRMGTPAGTKFQLAAVLVDAGQRADWQAGQAIVELPEGTPISRPINLLHSGND